MENKLYNPCIAKWGWSNGRSSVYIWNIHNEYNYRLLMEALKTIVQVQ
jgi:hypothetical protein